MAVPQPKSRSILLAVGAIVLLFLLWGAWTWGNWGEPGRGVDESPRAIVQPTTVPSAGPRTEKATPATKAQIDASGDAAEGDQSVTRAPPAA